MNIERNIDNINNHQGLSGTALKWIAIITMLIDHVGAAILEWRPFYYYDGVAVMDKICRTIGRISFPIFCFLLVEGFCHTGNVKKYMMRMSAFALISEIPFDLAFSGQVFDMGHQNVFLTLFLGLAMMAGLRRCEHISGFGGTLQRAGSLLIPCVLAWMFRTDYQYMGILIMLVFYWYRQIPSMRMAAGIPLLVMSSVDNYGAAVLSFLPVQLYNGKKGTSLKYLFYCFYPGHLILLYLLRVFLLK